MKYLVRFHNGRRVKVTAATPNLAYGLAKRKMDMQPVSVEEYKGSPFLVGFALVMLFVIFIKCYLVIGG